MSKLMTSAMGVVVAVMVLGFASDASGQGFGFSIGGHGRHGRHVSVGFGFPSGHCAPAPRHHVHSACCRTWAPGQWQNHCEQVWVPGCARQVWVEAVYRTDYDHCGRPVQVLVSCGHYETVQDQGHYETVNRQVWVEGFWQTTCGF